MFQVFLIFDIFLFCCIFFRLILHAGVSRKSPIQLVESICVFHHMFAFRLTNCQARSNEWFVFVPLSYSPVLIRIAFTEKDVPPFSSSSSSVPYGFLRTGEWIYFITEIHYLLRKRSWACPPVAMSMRIGSVWWAMCVSARNVIIFRDDKKSTKKKHKQRAL